MKVRFKGTTETRTGGCSVCGAGHKSKHKFVMVKQYIMPSGMMKTFRAGNVEEVSDTDGEFLLSYDCFERVS